MSTGHRFSRVHPPGSRVHGPVTYTSCVLATLRKGTIDECLMKKYPKGRFRIVGYQVVATYVNLTVMQILGLVDSYWPIAIMTQSNQLNLVLTL